jgi:hypothetical protein
MVSNGAGLDDDTNLATIGSKVVFIPSANAVIACRGNLLISTLSGLCEIPHFRRA